ncbi:choice-of-anchor B family protein [Aquimarina sp. 2201CG1-2-11]|uniref:choice-of-anchor B family protein n=1 Tax=Aquimarina discodermiae TaxID=3231043 RepID=UPI0034624B31
MKKLTLTILLLTTTVFLYGQTRCINGKAGNYPCKDYDLMSRISLSAMNASGGNDSWGWTDPTTNKEYAIIGLNNGTAFIDISNPTSPVYLGKVPTATSNSLWRDIKVYKDHAFIVSEASGHGLQVFDLTRLRNVANPPQNFTADKRYTGFGNAHNIVINEDSGYAYIVGALRGGRYRGGPLFIDIRDPKNPKDAGGFLSTGIDPYTHDAQVVNYNGPDSDYTGKEILIGSNQKEVVIADITNKNNPKLISTIRYSDVHYTHQGWFTEDMRYFLLGDEVDETNVGFNTKTIVFDFQDLDNPKVHMNYTGPTPATDHNGYVKGDLFYLANYRAGIRIIDISNVGNKSMAEVGYFDTYTSSNSANMDGVWNVYPYFNSGNIVLSDTVGGFFLVKKSGSTDPCTVATPTGVTSSGITTTSAIISWSEVTDTTYDIRYRRTGATNWTTNAVSTNSYTITNLTANTSYEVQVRSKCQSGSPSNYSASIRFTTNSVEINYCDSNGRTTSDEYISNVNLGTINNTTTASSGGYGDYTTISTDLSIGNSNTITITPTWTGSIYAEAYSVWIDYNRNGDFTDAGEQVWSNTPSTATTVNGTFTVPTGTPKGITRMRVSMKYNGVPTSCESFQYGEVEDYSVNITDGGVGIPGCTSGITSFPYNEGFENTIGNWSQSNSDNLDWSINSGGTPSRDTGPSAASNGTYYLFVEASGNGTGFPNKQAVLTSPCFNLTNETSAAFSFDYHMYGASDMGSFLVEVSANNGNTWASLWTQSTNQGNSWKTATINLAAYVGKNIQLRFNRTTGNTWQNDIAIDNVSLTTNISKNDFPKEKEEIILNLYPNPVTGNKLNLYMRGVERHAEYEIISVLGQLVGKGNVSNTIDISSLNTGAYFLRVESEGNLIMKRFIRE